MPGAASNGHCLPVCDEFRMTSWNNCSVEKKGESSYNIIDNNGDSLLSFQL